MLQRSTERQRNTLKVIYMEVTIIVYNGSQNVFKHKKNGKNYELKLSKQKHRENTRTEYEVPIRRWAVICGFNGRGPNFRLSPNSGLLFQANNRVLWRFWAPSSLLLYYFATVEFGYTDRTDRNIRSTRKWLRHCPGHNVNHCRDNGGYGCSGD